MKKVHIQNKSPKYFLFKNEKGIYNFFNLNTIYWLKNSNFYYNIMKKKENFNFTDSKVLSMFLRTKQQRGPTFARNFLTSKLARKKRHFFIGLEEKDKKVLSDKIDISLKNIFSFNPPYIKEIEFSNTDIKKIVGSIKKSKPDFVWVCVGSPKQEVLANQLYKYYKSNYFNVGAALDFILGKKKESPEFFQKTGIEWFYRLITDFKYSKKKVWYSLVGLWYLIGGKVKIKVKG